MPDETRRFSSTIDFLPLLSTYEDIDYYRILRSVSGSRSHYLMVCLKPTTNSGDDEYMSAHTIEMKHTARIISAKCMPFWNPELVAAVDRNLGVSLWSVNQQDSTGYKMYQRNGMLPQALCWSARKKFQLLIPSGDGYVYVYEDISNRDCAGFFDREHFPHAGSWSTENIFGTVGHDAHFVIWDTRTRAICIKNKAHSGCTMAIDFSVTHCEIFCTGSNDCSIALWDMRNCSQSLSRAYVGNRAVSKLLWSPYSTGKLALAEGGPEPHIASVSEEDNRISNLFAYSGQQGSVCDMAWHYYRKDILIFVNQNGSTVIWDMYDMW